MRVHATAMSVAPRFEAVSHKFAGSKSLARARGFSEVLSGFKQEQSRTIPQSLDGFIRAWDQSVVRQGRLMQQVPTGMRPFIELQIEVNRLNLQTQVLTKAGESISGTLQKVQQMGGN